MDAQGSIRRLTPTSDPHLWKAASASIGRLGIILDLTISIVRNTPVRRSKADISTEEFVTSVQRLQEDFKAAAGPHALAAFAGAAEGAGGGNSSNAGSSGLGSISPLASYAVWQAVKSFDETQVHKVTAAAAAAPAAAAVMAHVTRCAAHASVVLLHSCQDSGSSTQQPVSKLA
jgi:hypothetical protein